MTSRTFNDTFGDLIRHLKFQMRKVLETRNSNQATRHSPLERRGCLGMRLSQLVILPLQLPFANNSDWYASIIRITTVN